MTSLDVKSKVKIRRQTSATLIWSNFRILTQDTRHVVEVFYSSVWSVLEGGYTAYIKDKYNLSVQPMVNYLEKVRTTNGLKTIEIILTLVEYLVKNPAILLSHQHSQCSTIISVCAWAQCFDTIISHTCDVFRLFSLNLSRFNIRLCLQVAMSVQLCHGQRWCSFVLPTLTLPHTLQVKWQDISTRQQWINSVEPCVVINLFVRITNHY